MQSRLLNRITIFFSILLVQDLFLLCCTASNPLLNKILPWKREKVTRSKNDRIPASEGKEEQEEVESMGQVVRTMSYDYAGNKANAISSLNLIGNELKWFRLDDGVMGGRSETVHVHSNNSNSLLFKGIINTDGGGFTSIRAPIPANILNRNDMIGLKITFRGDGRTYKVLLSKGNQSGGPFANNPSWQVDLPTKKMTDDDGGGEWQESMVLFSDFSPSFGPRAVSNKDQYTLIPDEMQEVGLMLSLLLSNGKPNPPQTFGTGIFDFQLVVKSIEPIMAAKASSEKEECENTVQKQ